MSFEFFLAKRYMKGNRHTWGGSLTSVIAIGGVSVGVAALITTLAVMTGFREDIRNKILGVQPHVFVMGYQGNPLAERDWSDVFGNIREVVAWAPFVTNQALVRKGPETMGIVVKGVDPEREASVTGLSEHVRQGSWEELAAPPKGSHPSILLGQELAQALNARVGDEVLLAIPTSDVNALMALPTLYPFRVAGILETGLYDYDSTLAVVTLPVAQHLFQMKDRYSGLGVRIEDPDEPDGVLIKIRHHLGTPARLVSWLGMNRNLFAALKLEKIMMFLILALITLVAAFNIVSNLLLVTAQKVREIGILRAMGARRSAVQKIFLYKGLLMGGLGTGFGLALGIFLSLILKRYQFIQLPADVYYVKTLPVKILASDVGLVAGAAFLVVLAATLYPARLASKLDALTAIRQG